MSDEIQTKQIIDYNPTTTLATGDKLLLQKADGTTMNVDYAELARNIITQYNAQTLAGSAQSVKSALDILNNNISREILSSGTNLNTLVASNFTNKYYRGSAINAMTNIPSDLSSNAFPFALDVVAINTYSKQILYMYGGQNYTYERRQVQQSGSTVWSAWEKMPTRSEVDALNSNLHYEPVTDWNAFKPTEARSRRYGFSVGSDGVSNLPFTDSNPTFFGYVEGSTAYCTQTLCTQYTSSTATRNRIFTRLLVNNTWDTWHEVKMNHDVLPACDLNDMRYNGSFLLNASYTYGHCPTANGGVFEVTAPLFTGAYCSQRIINSEGVFVRYGGATSTTWTEWEHVPTRSELTALNNSLPTKPFIPYQIVKAQDYDTLPIGLVYNQEVGEHCPTNTGYILVLTLAFNNAGVAGCQLGVDMASTTPKLWYRTKVSQVWRDWKQLVNE